MILQVSFQALRSVRFSDYAVRFVLGGTATVVTGVISSFAGAEVAGLFLALPAIFCASVTLIERKERDRKRKQGMPGQQRGRDAAALEAAGAALGSLGMAAFAWTAWWMLPVTPWLALTCATTIWILVSGSAWYVQHRWRQNERLRYRQTIQRMEP